jgi:hypothetical protein
MKSLIRRAAALVVASSLAVVAPSIVPVPAFARPVPIGCGVEPATFLPPDTAYAVPIAPCPPTHFVSPWPAFVVIAAAASTIIDAIFVWNTQCRELTSREAMLSAGLPVVGWAFNDQNNQCRKK